MPFSRLPGTQLVLLRWGGVVEKVENTVLGSACVNHVRRI